MDCREMYVSMPEDKPQAGHMDLRSCLWLSQRPSPTELRRGYRSIVLLVDRMSLLTSLAATRSGCLHASGPVLGWSVARDK